MIKYKKNLLAAILSTALFVLLTSNTLAQTDLPQSGFISQVSAEDGTVKIGEETFTVRQSLRVVSPDGKKSRRVQQGDLVIGRIVKFRASRETPLRRIVVISFPAA